MFNGFLHLPQCRLTMLIVVRVGTRTMGTIVGTMLIVERVVLASSLRKDSDAAAL